MNAAATTQDPNIKLAALLYGSALKAQLDVELMVGESQDFEARAAVADAQRRVESAHRDLVMAVAASTARELLAEAMAQAVAQ